MVGAQDVDAVLESLFVQGDGVLGCVVFLGLGSFSSRESIG